MDFHEYVRALLPELRVRREPEIVNEIAEHLAELYDEARRDGLTHDAALERARAALPERIEPFVGELRSASEPLGRAHARFGVVSDLRRDLRYGVRLVLQTPGFSAAIVLTLALGVGANAAIFTAIDATLLRHGPLRAPEQLVHVYSATADGRAPYITTSYPNYVDLRDHGGFEGLAAYASIPLALDLGGTTRGLASLVVSGDYFEVLGVPLAHGRGFAPHEDRAGVLTRVVVFSHDAWQKYFAGDPTIVGRQISLNGHPYTVIGVAPAGFHGATVGQSAEAWVPMALQPEVRPPSAGLRRSLGSANLLDARGPGWLNLVGRLADGRGRDAAMAALDVLAHQLEAAHPNSNRDRRFNVVPLGEGPGVRTTVRPLLLALGVAVVLVLVIACGNVAGLLIVRALARQKEVAVRLALGASRGRLVRQWFAESTVFALLGAAGALLLAWWAMPLLYGFGIPATVDLSVNTRVLSFTLAAALASAFLFGSIAIVHTLGGDTAHALHEESRASTASLRAIRWRTGFVVVQVALTLVLLVGAGLFLRTLRNAYGVELGYDVDRVLLTEVNLDMRGYSPDAGQLAYAQMLAGIRAIPGVTAAGAARVAVLSGGSRVTSVTLDGRPIAADGSNAIDVRTNVVSHGYLAALGIPVLHGRDFDASDRAGTARVALVSQSLAARLWPSSDPIGKSLVSGATLTVIGVIPDVVYTTPIESDPPGFFLSLLAQAYESGVRLHVRTVGDPIEVFPAVQQAVRRVDPLLALAPPVRLRESLEATLGEQRVMARLVALFATLSLALAVVGLYGVLAYVVTQRRGEIGVRMALGAEPGSILRMILGQGLAMVAIGSVAGVLGSLGLARYIEARLFGVAASDPVIIASVCVVMLISAAAACLVPARRATRVDPAEVLKAV